MDANVTHDLGTLYLLLGVIAVIALAVVMNIEALSGGAKLLLVTLVVAVTVSVGHYQYRQQSGGVEQTVASAKDAGEAFGHIVRQLRQ
ncbi:MAG: hypothetical protein OEW58_03005 [Gammaproteobacteria bacterium]|nr:hypothetical protein [Gammaproteobacteria bacterium]